MADSVKRALVTASVAISASVVAYELAGRRWQERWGATDDETILPLPGDDLVAEPASQVTRAITIDAPPDAVWPWLVQLGADRGGFYSYDWLEDLFGLGIHSADDIVPAWQQLAVGDLVAAERGRSGGWYVMELRPNEAMVLEVADVKAGRPVRRDEKLGWQFVWIFALRPAPGGGTRLLVRERTGFDRSLTKVAMAPIGLVSFVMTRRMLLGIKARAGRLTPASAGRDA